MKKKETESQSVKQMQVLASLRKAKIIQSQLITASLPDASDNEHVNDIISKKTTPKNRGRKPTNQKTAQPPQKQQSFLFTVVRYIM